MAKSKEKDLDLKKEREDEINKKLDSLIHSMNKKFGKETLKRNPEEVVKVPRWGLESPIISYVLGGGLPKGRIIELYGPECLSHDVFIPYSIFDKDGKRQNKKGGTIENLYYRFHNIPRKGKGCFQRKQTINSEFYVASINEKDRVISNKIKNVIKSGKKDIYEVTTENNFKLKSTLDHKFYVGQNLYKKLEDLKVDDLIYVHNNTRFKKSENKNFKYKPIVVVKDRIKNIKYIGKEETYDIQCEEPYNNFIAQGIVVHNSGGKTSIATFMAAQVQKAGDKVAIIDAENSFDLEYAQTLGLNVKDLLFTQPTSGEQALEIAKDMAESGIVKFIVVDSVAALTPLAEIEGEMADQQMGLQARLMSKACRKLANPLQVNQCTIVFINQIREKIGVMFGNPECVTPDTLVDIL